MLNYPLNMNVSLNGPTLIYIDTEGNPIQLSLNNYQVQDVINDWNDQPDGDLEEGMKPRMLNPPQGHVATYAPPKLQESATSVG